MCIRDSCGRALKSLGNRAGTQYLYCTKRADNMSCEGCGTLRTAEFEQFVYEAMVQKLSEFQTLTAKAETVNPLSLIHILTVYGKPAL